MNRDLPGRRGPGQLLSDPSHVLIRVAAAIRRGRRPGQRASLSASELEVQVPSPSPP
jgi:hypothetical protein